MSNPSLASDFEAYHAWRNAATKAIDDYRRWLDREDLGDTQRTLQLRQLLTRLADDKLNVAFIAEFSRGKSELINAIFLSDVKQRVLPSTAGRTTMCPTELRYDRDKPPQVELLPIETRATSAGVSEYRGYPEEWTRLPMDVGSPDSMRNAMQEVCRVKAVAPIEAERLGLYDATREDAGLALNPDGSVSIPAWRHAIINFPHPFLEQGLVVYDTPGLNAIGVEPELTFTLLPNAHAVLFVLSADAGVSRSDIEVWRDHIGLRGSARGRLVALNKIDGLWDELKEEAEIDAEIERQVRSCAAILGVDAQDVFPVSAQKGLQAKIQGNQALLHRSRLTALERALSEELIASKQELVRDQARLELTGVIEGTRTLLAARIANIEEQLNELRGLRGKNEEVVRQIMAKIAQDKMGFERGLQDFQALRSVFAQQSARLFQGIGTSAVQANIQRVREAMERSRFTAGLRDAMNRFFSEVDGNMRETTRQVDDINHMMDAMYRRLTDRHGIARPALPPFSTLRYQKELQRVEAAYRQRIDNVFTLLTTEQHALTTRFFEIIASRVIRVFEVATKEIDAWLRVIMSPMESQVREHQMQLRRRLESIKRIHKAAGTLEDRIGELQQVQAEAQRQAREHELSAAAIIECLDAPVVAAVPRSLAA